MTLSKLKGFLGLERLWYVSALYLWVRLAKTYCRRALALLLPAFFAFPFAPSCH